MLNKGLSDSEYIKGIQNKDQKVIVLFDKCFFPMVKTLVEKRGGTEDDAKDVMQEATIALFRLVNKKGFNLTSKLSTFFYSISEKDWFKHRNAKHKSQLKNIDPTFMNTTWSSDSYEVKVRHERRIDLMNECLKKLSKKCRKVLKLWLYENRSYDYIAKKLKIGNAKRAKDQKYWCSKKLEQYINDHPKYGELKNG